MIEVLHQDYIQTAKAKGLSSFQILIKHVFKNSFLPVISYLGPLTASIVTGGFAVEKIFGIPGLGQWFVLSIMNRDYTTIMGTTLFFSSFLMICVFAVDVLYCFFDPRIHLKTDNSSL
jgi:oligopeptide transport system permease protein